MKIRHTVLLGGPRPVAPLEPGRCCLCDGAADPPTRRPADPPTRRPADPPTEYVDDDAHDEHADQGAVHLRWQEHLPGQL